MTSFWKIIAILASITAQVSDGRPVINTSSGGFDWDLIKYLIAFGDSYTYVQGTNGYTDYSFIGSYLPGQFSITPSELWSDQIVQNFNGTAEGGPNWIEYLTGCGLSPGLTKPESCERQLWDFAFAGADVSEQFTALHHEWTVPLVNQTQQFLTWIEPQFKKHDSLQQENALVAIWIGINDIGDTSTWTNVSFPSFYDEIISTVFTESAEPIYEAGYRNFLFINLPPLDRTPLNVVKSDPRPNKTMIEWWDETLQQKTQAFSARYDDTNTFLYDANKFLNRILDSPREYGINNTTGYCPGYTDPDEVSNPEKYGCIPIDEYFWFNTGHMTSHVHSFLGPDIGQFLRQQSKK